MKKQAYFLIRTTVLLLVLITCLQGIAQEKKGEISDPDFHYYIANETRVSPTKIEFDLLLLNTNPSLTFELGTVQAGILLDPTFYNGGTVTAGIVPGSSTLSPAQVPTVITFAHRKNCIKMASRVPPGIGSGTVISTDPSRPTKVCRIALSNTKPWPAGDINPQFCLNHKPYPTKISKYDQETHLNTAMDVNPYTCFTQQKSTDKQVKSAGNEPMGNEKITIYPNPNTGNFTVSYGPVNPSVYELRVTNSAGSVVFRKNDIHVETVLKEEINLKEAVAGTYTVSIISTGEQLSRKFVIK
jgi:hypothetical protein